MEGLAKQNFVLGINLAKVCNDLPICTYFSVISKCFDLMNNDFQILWMKWTRLWKEKMTKILHM